MCDEEELRTKCDSETQTDYSQSSDEIVQDENRSPEPPTLSPELPMAFTNHNNNNNNYRKRILQDITDNSELKMPKLDPIFPSDDESPPSCTEVKLKLSPVFCLDQENSTSNMKYYVIDKSLVGQNAEMTELSLEAYQAVNRHNIINDSQDFHQQHTVTVEDCHSDMKTDTPEQNQTLYLSHKVGDSSNKKRVTIATLSNSSSPTQEEYPSFTPVSISPNDKRFKLSTPMPFAHQAGIPTESTPQMSRMPAFPPPSQGSYVYTPHPKSGQLFYVSTISDASPDLLPGTVQTSETITKSNLGRNSSPFSQLIPGSLTLNSSTEGDTPRNVDDDDKLSLNAKRFVSNRQRYDLLNSPEMLEDEPRETHNLKERRRRARIKEACDLMRTIIPGMSEKTDKATVFEFGARYIHFLKTYTGCKYDKDFLIKYSPY